MIPILCLIGIALIVGAIVVGMLRPESNAVIGMFWSGIFLSAVLGMLWLVAYAQNVNSIIKYETFYDTNTQNYAVVVNATASMLSTDKFTNKLIAGNIEKLGQGAIVSERLKEWRNAINDYNLGINTLRTWRNNFLVGPLVVPEIPERYKLLIIR